MVQPGEPKSDVQAMKPGHWATGTQRMRAVYQDFVGTEDTTVVNGRGERVPGGRDAAGRSNRCGR